MNTYLIMDNRQFILLFSFFSFFSVFNGMHIQHLQSPLNEYFTSMFDDSIHCLFGLMHFFLSIRLVVGTSYSEKYASIAGNVFMFETLWARNKNDTLSFLFFYSRPKNYYNELYDIFLSLDKIDNMLCDLHFKSFTIQNNHNKVDSRHSGFFFFLFFFSSSFVDRRRCRFASICLLNS